MVDFQDFKSPLVVLIAAIIAQCVYSYIRTQFLTRKLGAKPILHTKKDGLFGFRIAFQLAKASKMGGQLGMLDQRLNSLTPGASKTYKFKLTMMNVIHTADPENIKALLATQFTDFGLGLRNKQFKPFLGDGIFTLDSESWKHSRLMLRPQFLRERISQLTSLETHLQNMFAHINSHKGEPFDFQKLVLRLTLDYSTEFLFGQSVGSMDDGTIKYTSNHSLKNLIEEDQALKESFIDSFDFCQAYTLWRIFRSKLYFTLNSNEYKERCSQVKLFAEKYVKDALALSPEELEKKSENYTFLYELVRKVRDPVVVRDQLLNILIAGRDTTAELLSFAMLEMSRDPTIVKKLRKEIESKFCLGKDADLSLITFEGLKKCDYMKAFVSELLRLYPVVPNNARVANKDTTLPRGGGPDGNDPIFIKKGYNIMYSVYVTHRDEQFYGPDAKTFRPERWLEPDAGKFGWAYLPFNGGPRICIGQQFALTEISYVLTRLVQVFDSFEAANSDPIVCDSFLTISVRGGVNVIVK